MGTVAAVTEATLPGRRHGVALDQAVAVEQIATSGRKARNRRDAAGRHAL